MKLTLVIFATALISCIETVSYAARLSGATTGRIGTSTSLFNILVVFSRFAVMGQMIILGSMLDNAIRHNDPAHIDELVFNFHMVLLAASVGIIIGMLIMPSIARILAIGTRKLDRHGSIPRIVLSEGIFRLIGRLPSQFWLPSFRANWREIRAATVPSSFFWLNAAIFSFYSLANLSSLYAGAMIPDFRTVANNMASVINGVGTILLVIFVDPVSSKLLDDVVGEKRPLRDLKASVFHLGLGRLFGTLVAQLLLWPFAMFIKLIVLFIEHPM